MKTSDYREEIDYRIDGIPCLIGVIDFISVEGSGRYDAPSDVDYYGYTECDFDILDRKGYRARWLERKIDKDITADIERTIADNYAALEEDNFDPPD